MNLNHLNLCTSDVPALCDLFARHFDFRVELRSAEAALLHGPDGFFLVLMRTGPDSPRTYPASLPFRFHVGFRLESEAQVLAKHQELSAAGYQLDPIKRYQAMGADWTAFYCHCEDGIDIEVNTRAPQAGQ